MFSVMYPQLQGIDFRWDAVQLDVPVYSLDGQAELALRRNLPGRGERCRGELWWATSGCDMWPKLLLLTMLE